MKAHRSPFPLPARQRAVLALIVGALVVAPLALAQDPVPPPPPPPASPTPDATPPAVNAPSADLGQRPPPMKGAAKVTLNVQNWTLQDLVKYFAELTGKNFILTEGGLKETVTIISHKPVTVSEAYEAFLQALEMNGYTPVVVGQNTRIVKSDTAAQTPLAVDTGTDIEAGANFVTQILPLENVSVADVQSVVQSLATPAAKIVAYAPSNTFIITESGNNLRRIVKIITQLDVAAPKSRLEVIPIRYAAAADIKGLIEQLYGTAETDPNAARTGAADRSTRRRPRREEGGEAPAAPAAPEGVTAGAESKYISKVISDERTNTLIVRANDQGIAAVKELIAQLDVDVDVSRQSQIHVVALENAKAEEVAQVLSNLSQGGSGSQQQRRSTSAPPANQAGRTRGADAAANRDAGAQAEGGGASATAVFDSGMRITSDESTNSLVIIASPDDFRVVKQVIDKLDVRRRQVLIDTVILELTSDDTSSKKVGVHGPTQLSNDVAGFLGGQFGTNSLGLTQDLLSGLAVGVFGPTVSVPFAAATGLTEVDVPAFGIVLQALASNSSVDIVSNPQLLTLDNEEAKIVVGRKIPFPTNTTFSQFGQPIVSFQREDVATTLKVTPRVNSSNYVTLEVNVESAEVEQNNFGLDQNQAGLVTSKREVETAALVGDNQTVVLGGLVGTTDTRAETKVPILGDLPVIGVLFRSNTKSYRKSNLMIFLTPHIIDDPEDMVEIMRVKQAQREEYIRRFYGRSREEQMRELQELLKYSMNFYGEPSVYPNNAVPTSNTTVIDGSMPISDAAKQALDEALESAPAEAAPSSEPASPAEGP
jgi:general secretion pathway protein D